MSPVLYTFFGLDLGQRNDHSVLAAIDLAAGSTLRLRALHRFPLGTPYIEIPDRVRKCILPGKSALAVDAGGPGQPIVELLRQSGLGCPLLPALITGGAAGRRLASGHYTVPRRHLVALLRAAIHRRLLVFPAGMEGKAELAAELAAVLHAGRQIRHDDMAIAISLALWAAARRSPGLFCPNM